MAESASAVRRRILGEHGVLRAALDALVPLAERFERDDVKTGLELRDGASALYEEFAAHLEHEQHELEPALRARGAEGERLADRLSHEHREQRALLSYLRRRLQDHPTPTLLVAREVRHFAEYLRLDMAYEEATLLSAVALGEDGAGRRLGRQCTRAPSARIDTRLPGRRPASPTSRS